MTVKASMAQSSPLQRILAGVRDDLSDYRRLRELLDAQFAAALRHRADEIRDAVRGILELTAALEGRRRERVRLVEEVLAAERTASGNSKRPTPGPSLLGISACLPAAMRANFDACCGKLEQLVRECKRRNRRNCHVLTAQQEVMRQVLNPGAGIYAPV